jgi:hypothetical protein
MPFTSSQRLHAAAFNDVLTYRCLWIDCAVLCSIGCVEVLAYRPPSGKRNALVTVR